MGVGGSERNSLGVQKEKCSENLSISFPKGKRRGKQDAGVWRIPTSGQEGVPRIHTVCLTWRNMQCMPSLLHPPCISHHSCLREENIRHSLKFLPCGCHQLNSSCFPLLLIKSLQQKKCTKDLLCKNFTSIISLNLHKINMKQKLLFL